VSLHELSRKFLSRDQIHREQTVDEVVLELKCDLYARVDFETSRLTFRSPIPHLLKRLLNDWNRQRESAYCKPMFTIPSHVRGIIFDCDGTLADTMPLHLQSWERSMRELGGNITPEEFWGWAGVPTIRIIEMLNERHGYNIDPAAGYELKERYYVELIHNVEPIAEVVNVVEQYRGKLPMAVATGGGREIVRSTLTQIGLIEAFEHIVSADDVTHGKPAPDIFVEAARRIAVKPEYCIVFEDADNGIIAARAAGMQAIDIRDYPLKSTR
jgi:HAD superfamily hydrolase (TIGR01509 family)